MAVKQLVERSVTFRLKAQTHKLLVAALADFERPSDFMREAVERELDRRTRRAS